MIGLLKNILWLNFKKLKINIFWRILFVMINTMLFMSAARLTPDIPLMGIEAFYFVFILVFISNTLFLYIKITSDLSVVLLYRSIGASKSFIIFNNLAEMLIMFIISLIIFGLTAIFLTINLKLFLFSLLQGISVIILTLIFSYLTINRAEKIQKAL